MSNHKPSLEDLKLDIRSVLLTASRGFTLMQFNGTYKSMLGSNVPFREFGYKTSVDFLRTLPDVVTVSWCSRVNDYLLVGIADEKTAHIDDLVKKQKVTGKQKYLPPNRSTAAPRRQPYEYFHNNIPPRFQFASNPFIPISVKQEINTILKQYDEGISYQNFQLAYRRSFGKEFSHEKMGFSSLQECLDSVTGVTVRITNGEARIFKPSEVRRKVSDPPNPAPVSQSGFTSMNRNAPAAIQQKFQPEFRIPSPKPVLTESSKPVFSVPSPKPLLNVPSPKPLSDKPSLRPLLDKPSPKPLLSAPSPKPLLSVPSPRPVSNEPSPKPRLCTNAVQEWLFGKSNLHTSASISKFEDLDDFELPDEKDDDNSGISQVMQDNFKKILSKNPHGIWAADFPLHYQELTGYKFDLQELGYYTLNQLVDALPKIFRRIQPEGCRSDWLLFNVASSITSPSQLQKERSLASRTNDTFHASRELISNIRKILEAYPEGVFVDDFLHLYSLNCDQSLGLSESKCGSVEKFLLQIAELVPLKLDYTNSRKKVKIDTSTVPMSFYPSSSSMNGSFGSEIPQDTVLPGMQYEWQSIPASCANSYFEICIATVVDPGLMWIQLVGNDTTIALDHLMDELENCYKGPRSKCYKMLEEHIVIGTICAGVWSEDGSWHRIAITGMSSAAETVDVSFVDYGTNGKIMRSNLRYLRRKFLTLPAQSIKSRMAFIKPADGVSWNGKIRDDILHRYSNNKTLMAETIQSSHYPGFTSLWICDVSGEKDIYLNKQLIEKGYAAFVENDMPQTTVLESDPLHVLRQYSQPTYVQELPPQVPTPNSVKQEDLVQAFSTMLQLQTRTMPTTSAKDSVTDLSLRLPSLFGLDPSPINVMILQQLLSAGVTIPNIMQLLGKSNIPAPTSTMGISSSSVSGSSFPSSSVSGSSFPSSANNNLLPMGANSAKLTAATADGAVCVNSMFSSSLGVRPDSPEIFEDEDDDGTLEELCAQYSISTQRFVKRVYLKEGFMFHIVVVNGIPHVTSGDVSLMLWNQGSWDSLDRRLKSKQITIASNRISESVYPEIFYQLKCYNVSGIKKSDHTTSTNLVPLKNVIDILNIFGHPSTTIREEIALHVKSFNATDDIWKKFSLCDTENKHPNTETDNGKFHNMCIFDLKSTLKGLQYKRLTLMNKLSNAPNVVDPVKEISKIESQCKVYEGRIKEIESLCESYDFDCPEK